MRAGSLHDNSVPSMAVVPRLAPGTYACVTTQLHSLFPSLLTCSSANIASHKARPTPQAIIHSVSLYIQRKRQGHNNVEGLKSRRFFSSPIIFVSNHFCLFLFVTLFPPPFLLILEGFVGDSNTASQEQAPAWTLLLLLANLLLATSATTASAPLAGNFTSAALEAPGPARAQHSQPLKAQMVV